MLKKRRVEERLGSGMADLDLNYQLAVLLQLRIDGEEVQWLGHGLGDEQTVKGIGVVEGQTSHNERMLRPDRQLMETVCHNLIEELLRVGINLSEAGFDCNFPDRG